ncbi:MAG: copper resistance system multicopper oxidase [Brachymonas sp.]
MPNVTASSLSPALPRRRFVQSVAASGLLLGLGALPPHARAQNASSHSGQAQELRGNSFDLVLSAATVNVTGKPSMATLINGSLPGPTLRWREGEVVTIRVKNLLAEDTSIHWHGILLPYQMDGVPGVSFAGIKPGETFTYQFKVQQHGTYWYHSHSAMQELTGLYGAIIIDPADDSQRIRADRDFVVQLSDWSDTDPMRIMMNLRKHGGYYNQNQPTALRFAQDVRRYGLKTASDMRQMWNQMRMSPTDLADVSAMALTYLMNGQTPAANWTGLFAKGETVLLRFINAAGHTFYDVHIPGLKLKVVAVDGVALEPVSVDEFRFGPGETYDVLVQPVDDAHTIFAQSMDRSGYARGTLATRAGLSAPVPALDAVQWLSMTDMMGAMEHGSMAGMAHGAMNHGAMNHGAMNHGAMNHGAMNHGAMAANPLAIPRRKVRHARSEFGPGVDARVDTPRTNLDDPGVGLRDNGRRVLTQADLHTLGGALDPRGAEREIELHLTGNMERYAWQFDGLEFGQSSPVHFQYGERVRVILHNDTMMTHPMHLHGMWQELETDQGLFQARRHTIPVQPAQRISFLLTADALGRWVWHCHLMFHMDMGMFREVVVTA